MVSGRTCRSELVRASLAIELVLRLAGIINSPLNRSPKWVPDHQRRPTVVVIRDMMMAARDREHDALGLHHLIGNYYAPMPQNDCVGGIGRPLTIIGSPEGVRFDRTRKGKRVNNASGRDDNCARLLCEHRCAWDYRLKSGKTLWNELCGRYHDGATKAAAMQRTWQSLAGKTDPQRHKEVAERLAIQAQDAARWRDQILQYFQGFSKLQITPPAGG